MAYYGPNANILGGIKLDLWHHEVVTDIIPVLKNLTLLFCIDLLSAITNGILLAITCKINSLKWIQKIQSQYWLIFAFTEARCMNEVCVLYNTISPQKGNICNQKNTVSPCIYKWVTKLSNSIKSFEIFQVFYSIFF